MSIKIEEFAKILYDANMKTAEFMFENNKLKKQVDEMSLAIKEATELVSSLCTPDEEQQERKDVWLNRWDK